MSVTDHDSTSKLDAHLVDPEGAHARVEQGALLVDVRRAVSRQNFGVVPGAEHVDKSEVDTRFADGDRSRPIVVFCGSVAGSGPVVEQLREFGYTDVVHIDGGFEAWKNSGLPTEELPAG
ncbi:rhodanese-like domain-containing protein [Rhodococcus rhodochrous]|uniref:rhodanese-like domain-containing protein n=1 Tax=Rhodococcus rhodochrous TaxID=1829 RepID=UPI001E2F6E57|nr:rhodanese-like domain-containing protein [Rhodococcus rhodochrous]MCD2100224.1 rhodanese-like domain-containing protein [Rhodococcus rhodochrous]MCQ4137596.1 rhodanese-like domain-containing protein [Rhodococcus rhodochrous]MDJ0021378.1 rhodanese-like domain-containing protein [Rhodococcus rhodochrous]